MQLKILFEKIAKMGIDNELINYSIATTSLYNINFQNIEDYPVMCLMPYGTHRTTKNIISYSIALYYIDRLNRDGSNEFDILSTSIEVLKSLVNNVRNIKGVVDVSTDYNITNFTDTQRLSDKCAGAFVTLNVDVLNENSCSLADNEVEENTIKLKNQIKYLSIDKNGRYNVTYDEGYNGLKEVEIDVELDTSFYVEEGYNEGKNVGIEEGRQLQKELLAAIYVTENGTYNREDGYSEIVVEVPDLNGDYDTGYNEGFNAGDVEGYNRGKTDGYNEGYNVGYDEGEENGITNAGEIIAQTAQVLDITENGTYYTKYSDNIVYPDLVTGIYPDGENFYNYANLTNIVYNTGIIPTKDCKVEFWYKYANTQSNLRDMVMFIGSGKEADSTNTYQLMKESDTDAIWSNWGGKKNFAFIDYGEWNHIIISYLDGLVINGVKLYDVNLPQNNGNSPFYINGIEYSLSNNINGFFGMIKITTNGVENIIIPTAEGLKNITTDEMLEVVYNEGTYEYINNDPIILDNLIKSVDVDVQLKVNITETGLKLGYSTFTEVPEIFDFNGVTDMSNMFNNCGSLISIPELNTSNVTDMSSMFYYCRKLQTIPELDTSNVFNMSQMFYYCQDLQAIPPIDTSNVTNMNSMFHYCRSLTSIPALQAGKLNKPSTYQGVIGSYELPNVTEFGGFIGLKVQLVGSYNLVRLPNLNYQSCINVLNGLYDFTGNGETPTSEQGQLQVHQNFIDLVGDEISIATNKGWLIFK